jgi:hypothetical protein
MEEAVSYGNGKDDHVLIECAGFEKVTSAELTNLEGKTTDELEIDVMASYHGELRHCSLTFRTYRCEVMASDIPVFAGAVTKVQSYLAQHCRPTWLRRHRRGDVTLAVGCLIIIETMAVIALYKGHAPSWVQALVFELMPAILIWVLLTLMERPSARIRLVPRSKHRTWWDRNGDRSLVVIGIVVTIVLGVAGIIVAKK